MQHAQKRGRTPWHGPDTCSRRARLGSAWSAAALAVSTTTTVTWCASCVIALTRGTPRISRVQRRSKLRSASYDWRPPPTVGQPKESHSVPRGLFKGLRHLFDKRETGMVYVVVSDRCQSHSLVRILIYH